MEAIGFCISSEVCTTHIRDELRMHIRKKPCDVPLLLLRWMFGCSYPPRRCAYRALRAASMVASGTHSRPFKDAPKLREAFGLRQLRSRIPMAFFAPLLLATYDAVCSTVSLVLLQFDGGRRASDSTCVRKIRGSGSRRLTRQVACVCDHGSCSVNGISMHSDTLSHKEAFTKVWRRWSQGERHSNLRSADDNLDGVARE